MKKVIIIGSGFSSLSASCYLAKAGYDVTMLEKNTTTGGRARQLKTNGFVFDIGPTFYWMPDVFDKFFADFNKKTSDYYQLDQLNPAYQIYFGKNDAISISEDFNETRDTFEKIEPGSGKQLERFINKARINYDIAIKKLVYNPGENIFEIINRKTITKLYEFILTIKNQVSGYVKNDKLRKVLEFPVLFLGAKPSNTPSFYNFMNYADLKLGTWHPQGGMYKVVEGMQTLAQSLGVKTITDSPVLKIDIQNGKVKGVESKSGYLECDVLLSGADYHHTETLLPEQYRQYTESYWDKKIFAPSALLFFVGFNKKIEAVNHHTLFFDTDFEEHAKTIYDTKEWPNKPLFYASFPSKTDISSAPEGKEAAIFLVPIAPDIEDTKELREHYFNQIIERVEKLTDQKLKEDILFKESYCVDNFKDDYNSYKGNAYGLANTLMQTHILRPKLKSKKVDNLYFCGQLTVPGPGVPPSLISGKVVSELILKHSK
ncbi:MULTISPECIES: phytoene desaturase family protein [Cellulophaga]|uniref:Phytoene desaturase n=1 Tax=Cellulophaga lytica (strain ATCC 23178 / DSM 7489 / JCM 8516 / NBRC 14961 / NCIMB 1423 / VKM B-1433 / Cy l20) TaxID=867900 RepID=F0R9H1_CELLC|nr:MULTISPECIES: phytoene desaturase family protein [Cellulophaga]ADY28293.1 phytoene desaturase [Cellulophaga lytica DSM 7489]AIM59362.1 phytoene dehydrogenase [Cellulophaga lytica]APU09173.1 phytoene dehydrogenase [Cellulophaga lytica]MDO6853777.1 phytoene desaturase family protein [Cellulophaga lytica]TVZ09141.1 phytoene desaturase [Cellulophaga sp. RHA_52]